MKSIYLLIATLFIIQTNASCQSNKSLRNFDISPDDKQIVFAYVKNHTSAVYTINVDGSNIKKIIGSNGDIFFESPKYSKDGKKFIYLLYKKDSNNGSINLTDIDGHNNEKLTDDNHIITEATFSRDGESVYFCQANEYAAYSPIGVKAPHNMDIYRIGIKDKKIVKVSNLKSYQISSISDQDDNYILMRNEAGSNGGMGLLTKGNVTEFKRMVPINDPRKLAEIYYMPTYSERFKMLVFIAPYEIFVMKLQDKIAKSVFFNKGRHDINNLCIFKNEKKILFSTGDDANLHTINFDGTGLSIISINL
jgi:Tol biopolymer transport system component